MIRSGELHVMKEIAKKEPEKNPGFDTFQKLTYLYNCVNSQSSPLVPPWWNKASCRIWHLINVFDYKAMPFSDSESLSLIFDTIVIKFSKIKKKIHIRIDHVVRQIIIILFEKCYLPRWQTKT